jgi:GNAT superfamily N-acetyltransferase
MSETTTITIHHLQMTSVGQFQPSRRTISNLEIRAAEIPSPEFSRFLYASVGNRWKWYERLEWTRQQWLDYLDRPQQETWVAYLHGTPIGYFELEQQDRGSVEIVYFGLMPDFIGRGVGGPLLTRAVQCAWDSDARRVWVHTCSLDHPNALNNYLSRGFTMFKVEEKSITLPVGPCSVPSAFERTKLVSLRSH